MRIGGLDHLQDPPDHDGARRVGEARQFVEVLLGVLGVPAALARGAGEQRPLARGGDFVEGAWAHRARLPGVTGRA